MKLTDLTGPEQDALMDWTNNAEGDLRRHLEEYQNFRGELERLLAVMGETDPAKSLTAFLQEMVPVWIGRRLANGYCHNCEVTGHEYGTGEDC